MAVKFGINLWNWVNSLGVSCCGLPQRIKYMGFDAIELPMTTSHIPEKLILEIKNQKLDVSLCASLGEGRDISSFDENIRKSTINYMVECLDNGAKVGAGVFAGPIYAGGGKRHLLSEEEKKREWDLAVTGIGKVAKAAKRNNIKLAIEPLNRYRTSVVNNVEQALKLVEDINEDNVGIHFDTYQAGIEERDMVEAVNKSLQTNKLFHFHACSNFRGIPGQGYFPWDQIWESLLKYNYNGYITMETFILGGFDSGWMSIGKPDDVAREGISYLRENSILSILKNKNFRE